MIVFIRLPTQLSSIIFALFHLHSRYMNLYLFLRDHLVIILVFCLWSHPISHHRTCSFSIMQRHILSFLCHANLCLQVQAHHQLCPSKKKTLSLLSNFLRSYVLFISVMMILLSISTTMFQKVDEKNEEEVKALRTSTPIIDGSDIMLQFFLHRWVVNCETNLMSLLNS